MSIQNPNINVEDEADRNLHNAAFRVGGICKALILPTCQQQIKAAE
jgi:hypothetical protein